jgi:UDP-3-O-acyl N-acetylglucosamine deacetylase
MEGLGLFSALPSRLTILPAPSGGGIRVRRTDVSDQVPFDADVQHVIARPRQTVLSPIPNAAGPGVHTVEHVFSALHALGVSDALLELHGPEVPMDDGSALGFARAILDAGLAPVSGPARTPLVVRELVRVEDAGGWIEATPSAGPWLEVEYRLDYGPGAPIEPQSFVFRVDYASPDIDGYLTQIAPARTFCTELEAQQMRKAGLFSHLAPRDVLVIGPNGPIDTSYRLEREPSRHKVLDVIGDLLLAGAPIHAKVVACKSGHALNHALARSIAQAGSAELRVA